MNLRKLPKIIFMSVVLLLSTLLVVTPAAAFVSVGFGEEQQSHVDDVDPQNACSDAELQARNDTNSTVWMIGGCLATVLTLIAAQVMEPKPPASALLGQPPEYVATYTDCYKRAAKKRRTNKALTGCLIGAGAYGLLIVLYFAAAASNPYYY
ncbi:MAG: hypothetical protein ACE5G0_16060 [Rhodothermales bacterium]